MSEAVAAFFRDHPDAAAVATAVETVLDTLGPHDVRVSRSQVAFRRRRGFAYLWRPGQYVRSDVPVVLSVALPYESTSSRWKSVVHPTSGWWMHHLELELPSEVDDEVADWLAQAWEAAA